MAKPCRIRVLNESGTGLEEITCHQLRADIPRLEQEYLDKNRGRKDARFEQMREDFERILSHCKCEMDLISPTD